jgi:hypothetical protein
MSTRLANQHSHLTSQESRSDTHDTQFKEVQTAQQHTNSMLECLLGEVQKLQQAKASSSPPSPPPRVECTVPVLNFTLYQPPHARFTKNS